MSSNCIIQNCSQNCCNIDGYCPTPYGTFNQQNCYYYYYYIWDYWWIYFVIVLSSLICLFSFIACIVCCIRRRRIQQGNTIVIAGGPGVYQGQGYGYAGDNTNYQMNQGFNNNNGMQRAGQPVYLANQKTPLGYNQENIYVV